MNRHDRLLAFALLAVVLLSAAGCNTAAPVRTTGYGAPGRLHRGQLEATGGGTTFGSGGLVLGLALADWLSLEATSDFRIGSWAMGGLALRFTPIRPNEFGKGIALDLELGGGLGAGYAEVCYELWGSNTCDDDLNPPWQDVFTYGGYAGVGLGWWARKWVALYFRARSGYSGSTEADYMVSVEALAGLEFRFSKGVDLYVAGGVFMAFTEVDMHHGYYGPVGELGLSLPFEVF